MKKPKRNLKSLERLRIKTFPARLFFTVVIIMIVISGILQVNFQSHKKISSNQNIKPFVSKKKYSYVNENTYKKTTVSKKESHRSNNTENKPNLQRPQENENIKQKPSENNEEKGNVKQKTKISKNDKGEITESTFNEKGKKTKQTVKDADGKIKSEVSFFYDNSDKLTAQVKNKYHSNGKISQKEEFKLHGEKLLIDEQTKYNSYGKITVKEKSYYSGKTLTSKTVIAYTGDGKEIGSSVLKYNPTGKVISSTRSPVKLDCGITLTFFEDSNYKYKDSDGSGNNVDGEINEPTAQVRAGDCWLLSAVNALSYTPYGQIIIKNSIKKNIDGSVTVTFQGTNKSYNISASDLEKAERCNLSNGDDDMMVLEIATILLFKETRPDRKSKKIDDDTAYISGGNFGEMYNPFGLKSKKERNPDDNKIDEMLDSFSTSINFINQPYYAMNFSWHPKEADEKPKLKCVDGKSYSLATGHAYSIKKVTSSTVTIINPWDSKEEITMDRNTFKSIQKDYSGDFYIYYGSRVYN